VILFIKKRGGGGGINHSMFVLHNYMTNFLFFIFFFIIIIIESASTKFSFLSNGNFFFWILFVGVVPRTLHLTSPTYLPRIPAWATESVGEMAGAEIKRERWAECRHHNSLQHEQDLWSNHLRRGVLGVNLVSPLLVSGIHVVNSKQNPWLLSVSYYRQPSSHVRTTHPLDTRHTRTSAAHKAIANSSTPMVMKNKLFHIINHTMRRVNTVAPMVMRSHVRNKFSPMALPKYAWAKHNDMFVVGL
jgi:hypothetical protein